MRDSLDQAAALTQSLTQRGFDQRAVQQAVVATITDEGKLTISEDELERLIAGIQTGGVSLGGDNPRARDAALESARRRVDREQDFYNRAREMLKRPTARRADVMSRGDELALRRYLEEVEGVDPSELDEQARDLSRAVRGQDAYEGNWFNQAGNQFWQSSLIMENLLGASGLEERTATAREQRERLKLYLRNQGIDAGPANPTAIDPRFLAVRDTNQRSLADIVGLGGGRSGSGSAGPTVNNYGTVVIQGGGRTGSASRVRNP